MRRKKRERKIVDSCSAGDSGDTGLTLGSGRSPGKGNGDPRHYSYLENPHGQRSLGATVHVVAKSCIGLSNFQFGHFELLIDQCED